MDPELSARLERMELTIGQSIQREIQASEARMRQHTDEAVTALRQHTDEAIAATRQHLDEVAATLRRHTDESAAGLRQDIDRVAQDTRRTGVIVEGLRSDFRVATEGFTTVNRRLDGVEAQAARTEQRVDVLETRVAAVEGPRNRRRRPRSS